MQVLCRDYLRKLGDVAARRGLGAFVRDTIDANKRGECAATEQEVEMLARCVDDSRMTRVEIPKLLGKSYRKCDEQGDFENIKKLPYQGIYSKVDALLYKSEKEHETFENKNTTL